MERSVSVTHSTTACVLLKIGNLRILTDPVFDVGTKKYRLGPLAWETRHIGPAIEPESLGRLDAILLSHVHHVDNLDDAGLEFVRQHVDQYPDAPVICGRYGTGRLDRPATRLHPWSKTEISDATGTEVIKVTATPTRHGPWWLPESRYPIGFVLEWEGQRDGAIYISGDTLYFKGIKQVAKRHKIAAAILHLGGVHFWPPWPPFVRVTMNARQAAKAATRLNPKTIIPIHYEQSVWTHFKVPMSRYQDEFADAGLGSRVKWLKAGKATPIEL